MSPAAHRRWIVVLVLAGLLGLPGCGVGPYSESADQREPADEVDPGLAMDAPSRIDRNPEALGVSVLGTGLEVDRDAEQAAAAYGLVYGNWSWATFADQQAELARLATGKLLDDLSKNPPGQQVMATLAADEQMSFAKLVAADTIASSSTAQTVVVVMRERLAQKGLTDPAPRHVVYRAELVLTQVGWRLETWDLLPS